MHPGRFNRLVAKAGVVIFAACLLAACSPGSAPPESAASPSPAIAAGDFIIPEAPSSSASVSAPSSKPPAEREYQNLTYAQAPGGLDLKLDLYLPSSGAHPGPWPVVAWFHGGGWAAGDKFPCPVTFLTTHGFAVASVNYRLAPGATHPAQINDCKAAVRWLRSRAAEYHLDPKRIGAAGQSAGAHLAALLGTSANERALEGRLGPLDVSSRVQAVCAISGPFELRPEFLSEVAQAADAQRIVSRFIGGTLEEKRDALLEASPANYVSGDDPPFLIMHGERDSLVPVNQSRRMHRALIRSGGRSALYIDPNAGHGMSIPALEVTISEFFNKTLGAP